MWECSPYVSGKMLTPAKYHPTLAKASALERLGRRGPISLCRESSVGNIGTSVDVDGVNELRMAVLGIRGDIEGDSRIVHDSLNCS